MPEETPRSVPPEGDPTASELPKEPLRKLTLGGSRPSGGSNSPRAGSTGVETDDADLTLIEAHCRAKAGAARWAAERQRRSLDRADFACENIPLDPEMVAWADKLTDCFYWLSTSATAQTPAIALLDEVGGCFQAVAAALALIEDQKDRRGGFERALNLLVEAQSALRQALQRLRAPDDPDQLEVYEWVRVTAARHHVFVRRFMRADDPADPAQWTGLLARIEAMARSDPQSQQQTLLINELRSHVNVLRQGAPADRVWKEVIEDVEALVRAGVPPSQRELREILMPVIDDLPAVNDLSASFQLVLREIDRYLANQETPPSDAANAPQVPTAQIKEAARLLAGRSIVLIGGLRHRESQSVLSAALGLKELIWIETREHQSIEGFEPSIARADVALVLLAIRWASHSFGDVKGFCDRYDKPLVRLPGGYNPNQVAAQILCQCSERLGRA